MLTHYTLAERQYSDTTREIETPATRLLGYYDVRLVIDVVSVDAGSTLTGYIEAVRNDGAVLARAPINIDAPGQYHVGCTYGGATDVLYRCNVTLIGRMRLGARVVSFDQGEDCPEVI